MIFHNVYFIQNVENKCEIRKKQAKCPKVRNSRLAMLDIF